MKKRDKRQIKANRPPRWKREQRKRKWEENKAKAYLGLSFIGLILLLLGLRLIVLEFKKSVWDGKSRLSVIKVNKDNDYELSVWLPEEMEFKNLILEPNLMVRAPFGFGEYQLKNIYRLGELEKDGGKLLTRALAVTIGMKVDGFLISSKSNLSSWDRLRWSLKMRGGRYRKRVIDINNEGVMSKSTLNDGTEVFRLSEVLIDELINREFFSQKIVDEQLVVAVLNASNVSHIGDSVGRMIKNIGGEVSLIGNEEEAKESKIVIAREELKESFLVENLKEILNSEKVEVGETVYKRADVVVVIGKDYTQL